MKVEDLESLNRFEFMDSAGISVRLDGDFSLLVDVLPATVPVTAEMSVGMKFFR